MSPEVETFVDVLMSECAGTQEVAPGSITLNDFFGDLVCCEHSGCFNTFFNRTSYNNSPMASGVPRQYCSQLCKGRARDKKELADRAKVRALKVQVVNIAFAYLHRDCAFSFDGRYEGPLTKPITVTVTIRKDKGYHPMPRAVHIEPLKQKVADGVTVHSEGDWQAKWTKPFSHSQPMPRAFSSFCASCVDVVIDDGARSVRVTKGVYLPIEHECGVARVYDLQGKLLEVKPL